MSVNNSSTFSSLGVASAIVAATSAAALALLQTDACSRRLLSPERLMSKRLIEFQYRWKTALDRAALFLRYAHVGQGSEFDSKTEILNTEFVTTTEDITALVARIVDNKERTLRIARLGRDTKQNEHGSNEYYLWLWEVDDANDDNASPNQPQTLYQVLLSSFGLALADAMERKITTSTFCFVADASASVGLEVLVDLVKATHKDAVYNIVTALWMVQLAVLIERRALSKQTLDKLVFGLCRMEALRAGRLAKTIVITIPSSIAPLLVPHLQTVFPDDRHVFVYTGCVKTVQLAMKQRQQSKSKRTLSLYGIDGSMLQFSDTVAYETPLATSLHKSASLMPSFSKALSALPVHQAGIVQTWMTSVDGFLAMKDNEQTNGYLPYVCKLDFFLSDQSLEKTDAYWSLRSLLQYMTGTKSSEIPLEVIDAAVSKLVDLRRQYSPANLGTLTDGEQRAIENVVFSHKLILIANKVLKDTCLPAEHWQLKQALRKGCSCCLVEAEVEEQMAEGSARTTASESPFLVGLSPATLSAKPSSGYVDGKTMFAFDPSRFG
jgi:hypothetical protein